MNKNISETNAGWQKVKAAMAQLQIKDWNEADRKTRDAFHTLWELIK